MKIPPSRSLSSFLASVETIRREWGTDNEDLWFRGEREEFGASRLEPKLYRSKSPSKKIMLEKLLDLEMELFDDFQRCGGPLCDRMPEDQWDWYFLMQHYGGPTRLLDWSDGALMALHFTLRDYPKATGNALVYVLDSDWLADLLDDSPVYGKTEKRWRTFCKQRGGWDKEDWDVTYLPHDAEDREIISLPKVPLVWDPSHVTRRFAAQRSRFMIFGAAPNWLQDLATKKDTRLCAITIERERIHEIKLELRGAGVTESVIFPDRWVGPRTEPIVGRSRWVLNLDRFNYQKRKRPI